MKTRPAPDDLRRLRWERAKRRLALIDAAAADPRNLAARFLTMAGNCRKAAARDRPPGRAWWVRNARADLAKATSWRAGR